MAQIAEITDLKRYKVVLHTPKVETAVETGPY